MPVVTDLYIYPIKSCAGIRVDSADLWETGLYLDRLWMVVDDEGHFVSQRTMPALARVATALRFESLQIRGGGIAVDPFGQPCCVQGRQRDPAVTGDKEGARMIGGTLVDRIAVRRHDAQRRPGAQHAQIGQPGPDRDGVLR